jgi:hypothetical protein
MAWLCFLSLPWLGVSFVPTSLFQHCVFPSPVQKMGTLVQLIADLHFLFGTNIADFIFLRGNVAVEYFSTLAEKFEPNKHLIPIQTLA